MNPVQLSVSRPVTVIMLMIGLAFVGTMALNSFSIDLFPNIDFPLCFIQTPYPGVDPAEMENIVTRKIEEEVNTVENIKRVTSSSFEGFSWITVEFNWGTNIDLAAGDLREKVDLAKRKLPRDIEQVTVAKLDINAQAVLDVSLGGDYELKALRQLADKEIKPAFERLSGVANVEVFGGLEREIRIKVFPDRLKATRLTIDDVIKAVSQDNQNTPVGNITEGNFKYLIRSEGEVPTPADLGKVIVKNQEGRPLYLSELAVISDSYKDIESVSRLNGKPSVSLAIKKESGANPVEISESVRKLIPRLEARFQDRLKITIGNDRSEFIRDSIDMVKSNARDGAILAVIILFLFLKNYRSTVIIGLSIPLAVIMTFVFLFPHKDITLNLMTLGGLALGIGMMVDNSVVVLDNIYRFQTNRGDDKRRECALEATQEVWLPIIASTLTTVAVFLPLGFVPGIVGQIFFNMALAIIYSLVASLLVAITLVPMLSSLILKVHPTPMWRAVAGFYRALPRWFLASYWRIFWAVLFVWGLRSVASSHPQGLTWFPAILAGLLLLPAVFGAVVSGFMTFMEWTVFPLFDWIIMRFLLQTYLLILRWLLGAGWRRWTYVVLMMTLFFGSFKFLPPMEFFPRMDRGIFVVHFEPPEGTSVEKTDDIAKQMEGILGGFPEVDKLLTNVKMGEGNITVVLVPKEKRTKPLPETIQAIRAKLEKVPGYRTMAFQEPKMGGPHGGKAIQVEVSGDDFTVIRQICKSVAAAIKDVPGLKDLDDGVKEGRPEIKVEFDREKIRDLGVDLFTIANMTRSFIYGPLAGKYKESNEEYDIRVEGADADKNEIAKLRTLELPLEKEKSVPLNQIAKVFEGKGLSKVDRKNLKRILSVQADIEGRVLQSVMDDVRQRLKGLALPAGYEISFGGEDEEMKEAFGNLGIALLASILLVYMIMASQYESFLDPFIIMFTIPLSFIGVVAVLKLTGFAFSITAMIGIIMLGGIVVNNGIILVEYINQRRATLKEDSITACVKSGELRYRAIWMTVSTTVLGMLPLGLGVGAGSDFYQPLALTVMGGLTISTILTLTYIPVLYVIVDDIATAIKQAVGELI